LPDASYNAHHLFVIEVEDRKGLYDYLRENNIFAQIHYIPVHTLPYYKNIGYEDANLINAENYYSKCISLPMYPTLSIKELEYTISNVIKYYE
jgi:dTDP-4-amino-4,6-dideoxygalactose transaminase